MNEDNHRPENQNAELSAIILNWNAASDTIRCVQSLQSWKNLRPDIWVVDNGSMDESSKSISQECPGIHLIRNSSNLGFAGGNNAGIKAALAMNDAPILLLNNDAAIEETAAQQLLNTLKAKPGHGCIGPLLYEDTRAHTLLSAGGKDISSHINTHMSRPQTAHPFYNVDYVPGTAVLIGTQVFHAIGLFDEDYFFSGEMADLCERARRKGYLNLIDTRAQVTHNLARSSEIRLTLHQYYILRNRFLFIRKFRRPQLPLFCFWLMYGVMAIINAALHREMQRVRAIRLALQDGLVGRFGGQNERVLKAISTTDI